MQTRSFILFLEVISDEASDNDDDTNEGLLIGVPLGVFILLSSLITVSILMLVLIRRWLMTSILRLPPPPCKCCFVHAHENIVKYLAFWNKK